MLEDFVVLGGQVGVVGHVRIGMGAQIAGASSVDENVPARRALGRHAGQAHPAVVPRDRRSSANLAKQKGGASTRRRAKELRRDGDGRRRRSKTR